MSDQNSLTDEKAVNPVTPEPIIRVMPEVYRGSTAGVKLTNQAATPKTIPLKAPTVQPKPVAIRPQLSAKAQPPVQVQVRAQSPAPVQGATTRTIAPQFGVPASVTPTNRSKLPVLDKPITTKVGQKLNRTILVALVLLGLLVIAIAYVVISAWWAASKAPITSKVVETPVVITTPVEVPPPIVQYKEVVLDTDSDGLTDVEETSLFGTSVSNPDSDGDSFLDGNETFSLYNPRGFTPERIADTPLVKLYHNEAFGFSLFTPFALTAHESEGGRNFVWEFVGGERIELNVKDPVSIAAQFGERTWKTRGGLEAIESMDRLTTTVQGKNYLYEFVYRPLAGTPAHFWMTTAMMINSLTLK